MIIKKDKKPPTVTDLQFSRKNPVVSQLVADNRPAFHGSFSPVFWPRATFRYNFKKPNYLKYARPIRASPSSRIIYSFVENFSGMEVLLPLMKIENFDSFIF